MLFDIALLSSLLLAPAILAAPRPSARIARRNVSLQSKPNSHLQQTDGPITSPNWSGAVWSEGADTFSGITGTFTVPTPSGPDGSSAAAWVGIDGDSCQSAILQTGVSFTVTGGQPQYSAWYEWYPAPSVDYSGIDIAAGDVIQLTVSASSPTEGTATIENQSNGQSTTVNLGSPVPLCGQDAEWIVEDYKQGDQQVPFANFGTVTFSDGEATGAATYTPSGAQILILEQNGQDLTSVSTSGSSVTIKYV